MPQLVSEMGHVVLPEEVEEKPLLKAQARKDVLTTSKNAVQKQASKEISEIFSKKNSKSRKSEQKGSDSKKPRKQGK